MQGFGKYNIDVKKNKIDFLSVSSHKFHGPKGVGFLFKNREVRINPMILGGGQQNGYRSGTLNSPGIIGTKIAAEKAYKNLLENKNKYIELKKYLINKLNKINEKYDIIIINSKDDDTFSPHIISVSFKGIRAEVMLHSLEEEEIYVSAGSACSSHDKKTSSTLRSIGLKPEIAESTIRISFSQYNTINEIDYFCEILSQKIPNLCLKKKVC